MNTNSNIEKLTDKTFIIKLTVGLDDIKKESDRVLKLFSESFENKGFRKGKAPLDVVKSHLGDQKLIEETLNSLLPQIYRQEISQHNLKPIIDPIVKIITHPLTLNTPWEIEIKGSEMPEIKIDSQAFVGIKKINEDKSLEKDKQTNKIFEYLLTKCQVNLSSVIIDHDLNRKLSDLVTQTQQAGITVDQFLSNQKMTIEEYRHQLAHTITDDWTINLAINQIAVDQKIVPSKEEIDKVIKENANLSSKPDLVSYLLTQQKVIDYLKSL